MNKSMYWVRVNLFDPVAYRLEYHNNNYYFRRIISIIRAVTIFIINLL